MPQADSTTTATPTPMPALPPLDSPPAIGCCGAFVEVAGVVVGEGVPCMVGFEVSVAIGEDQLDRFAPF